MQVIICSGNKGFGGEGVGGSGGGLGGTGREGVLMRMPGFNLKFQGNPRSPIHHKNSTTQCTVCVHYAGMLIIQHCTHRHTWQCDTLAQYTLWHMWTVLENGVKVVLHLFVRVHVDMTLDTLLSHIGPGVSTHPLPFAFGTFVLSKTSLLSLIRCQSFTFGPSLKQNSRIFR